jgi:hypothetical protein
MSDAGGAGLSGLGSAATPEEGACCAPADPKAP